MEIEPTKIEGMIPFRTIRSDFYDFDEDHYRAVGRRHHGVIKLGDPLRIRVKGTNLEQKLLDYELVEPEMENATLNLPLFAWISWSSWAFIGR